MNKLIINHERDYILDVNLDKAGQACAKIVITPEMARVGKEVILSHWLELVSGGPDESLEEIARDICTSMFLARS